MQEIAIAVQLVNTHAVQNHMATGMILEQVYLQIWKKRLPRTHKHCSPLPIPSHYLLCALTWPTPISPTDTLPKVMLF